MDDRLLTSFINYQRTMLHEEYEYAKYSIHMINHPLEKLVSATIYTHFVDGNPPSQTDLIYTLKIPQSTLRKIIRRLIKIQFIKEMPGKDSRFKHYKPTDLAIEGYKIWFARHLKTWFLWLDKCGFENDIYATTKDRVDLALGMYAQYGPYGKIEIEQLKDIINVMEKNSVQK